MALTKGATEARGKKAAAGPLPAVWRVDDALWAQAEQVLAAFDPPARFGPLRPASAPTAPTAPTSARPGTA